MADYDSLRQQVEADAGDFTSWSKLLAAVEEGSTAYPERVAPTFESFLAKFPLCFGYWCKYADLQRRLGEAGSVDAAEAQEKAATIYDRALEAVPLSVELWKAYTAHVKATTAGQASDQLRAAAFGVAALALLGALARHSRAHARPRRGAALAARRVAAAARARPRALRVGRPGRAPGARVARGRGRGAEADLRHGGVSAAPKPGRGQGRGARRVSGEARAGRAQRALKVHVRTGSGPTGAPALVL